MAEEAKGKAERQDVADALRLLVFRILVALEREYLCIMD